VVPVQGVGETTINTEHAMKMTIEFESLSEARVWARDLLGSQQEPATKAAPKPGVKVSAPQPKTDEASSNKAPQVSVKGLGRRQKEVVDFLTASPIGETVTTKDVASALGITSPNASNILSTLRTERGMTESPKRGHWRLVPDLHTQALAGDTIEVSDAASLLETEPDLMVGSDDTADIEVESAEGTSEVTLPTPVADYENILDDLDL